MSGPALQLRGLGLRFPGTTAPVVRGLDLTVARGSFVALVGASGVGKSTLLRIAAGLLPPSEGVADIPRPSAASPQPAALVFQDARLLPWRSSRANVIFGMERLGLTAAEMARRADMLLARVGLTAEAGRWPRQLSGGQRQRVAIARALAVEPELLLMDEPFGALDAITRDLLQDELAGLHAGSGRTVLFVTHDIAEAVHLADRVVLLGGRPARVAHDVPIALPRPRRRDDAVAVSLAADIRAHLMQELQARAVT